ncbi:MAG: Uma2 family endonuclease [Pirellulales bacterium]
MKLVAAVVPPGLVEWRRRMGADGHDEMWQGVLHMNPVPTGKHQNLVIELVTWLRAHWARPRGCKAFNERNVASVGGWPNDYRVPDVVLLTPERFQLDKDTHIEGGPTVVVEIRSPDDESYEKLPYYFGIGVAEVWVVDRDTREPEIYVSESESEPGSHDYTMRPPAADDWLRSDTTGIELRPAEGGKLGIRIAGDQATYRALPEE